MKKYYSLYTKLDCGDIGALDVEVHGTVEKSSEYTQTKLTCVSFVSDNGAMDLRPMLTKAARIDLEEQLEREYERDHEGD